MPDRVFIDSNLWIYSFVEAEEEQERRRIVIALLEELSQQSDIIISIQVVNETHWTLQRRYNVAVALRAGCEVLYSEDMQHDLVIQGRLRIQNPFW